MGYEALRKAFKAQPFVPFFVRLADGQSLEIDHPELLLVPPVPARTFVIYEDGGYRIVYLAMVSALEFITTRKKRRRAG